MSQGYYQYEIIFGVRRKYVADGNFELHNRPAESTLNGRPAEQVDDGKFMCWETKSPYHRVCIESYGSD